MSTIDNIKIRQNWITEETERCTKDLGVKKKDVGFLFLVGSLLLDCSPDDIDAEDIVEGGQDKQIDLIHIEDDQDKGHADITILQSKNSKRGFSSNGVIKIRNGLDWIFERPKSKVKKLDNRPFKEKIEELRSIRTVYGAANLTINVYHVKWRQVFSLERISGRG